MLRSKTVDKGKGPSEDRNGNKIPICQITGLENLAALDDVHLKRRVYRALKARSPRAPLQDLTGGADVDYCEKFSKASEATAEDIANYRQMSLRRIEPSRIKSMNPSDVHVQKLYKEQQEETAYVRKLLGLDAETKKTKKREAEKLAEKQPGKTGKTRTRIVKETTNTRTTSDAVLNRQEAASNYCERHTTPSKYSDVSGTAEGKSSVSKTLTHVNVTTPVLGRGRSKIALQPTVTLSPGIGDRSPSPIAIYTVVVDSRKPRSRTRNDAGKYVHTDSPLPKTVTKVGMALTVPSKRTVSREAGSGSGTGSRSGSRSGASSASAERSYPTRTRTTRRLVKAGATHFDDYEPDETALAGYYDMNKAADNFSALVVSDGSEEGCDGDSDDLDWQETPAVATRVRGRAVKGVAKGKSGGFAANNGKKPPFK